MSVISVALTDKRGRHLPGEAGVWVFIVGDMLVFGLLFLTFVFYRAHDLAPYAESQRTLNQAFGLINTLLLLTSSWFVALAIHGARKGWGRSVPRLFAAAFCCGLGFGGMKFLEYGEKIRAGITLATNDFYMFYFMFTGIHFVHVMIGLGVLAYLFAVSRQTHHTPADIGVLESGAIFWHMVDLLWIVLFALFYLMR